MSGPTVDALVAAYRRAAHDLGHSRVGSDKAERAEARIERLVARAERHGILDEFLTAALAD